MYHLLCVLSVLHPDLLGLSPSTTRPAWTWVECPIMKTQETAYGFWSCCAFSQTVRRACWATGYLRTFRPQPGSRSQWQVRVKAGLVLPFCCSPARLPALVLSPLLPQLPLGSLAWGHFLWKCPPHCECADGSSFMCYMNTSLPAEECHPL